MDDWKPVPGWAGYEVNSQGSVRSFRRGRPRVLAPQQSTQGYPQVKLYRGDGTFKFRRIHQLVAETFYGPRPEGLVTRHLDGDRTNNAASNLRYGTMAENIADEIRHGTHANSAKTHCPAGHPYNERNTYSAPGPGQHRKCRPCTNAAGYRSKARKRAAA